MPTVSPDQLRAWLPPTAYYREHLDRLAFSFSHLGELPARFSCLLVGSYGDEAAFLKGELGAGEVVALRSAAPGVPRRHRRTLRGPGGDTYDVELLAVDCEGAEEFPSGAGAFDLVIMWEVLEHFSVDPALALYRAIHALKPGGRLSLTTPNALWHIHTIAQLYGRNALGLKLQHHIPFATHWRLYSPAEVSELCREMGCSISTLTTFLHDKPLSLKSRLVHLVIERLRRHSGNGSRTLGQHLMVVAEKVGPSVVVRPEWLYPRTVDSSGEESQHC